MDLHRVETLLVVKREDRKLSSNCIAFCNEMCTFQHIVSYCIFEDEYLESKFCKRKFPLTKVKQEPKAKYCLSPDQWLLTVDREPEPIA